MSFTKDPDAVLDWAYDWTAWLAADEAITAATVTVEDGLTKDSSSVTTGIVTVWLSGGTVGESYAVLCHIVTDQGREDDRTFTVRVRQR